MLKIVPVYLDYCNFEKKKKGKKNHPYFWKETRQFSLLFKEEKCGSSQSPSSWWPPRALVYGAQNPHSSSHAEV